MADRRVAFVSARVGTPLACVVITKNEEANIQDCLASIAWAAERIVVDA